jgi:hypothetical protein
MKAQISPARVFWRGLASMPCAAGLRADWRLCFGHAFPHIEPFLVPAASPRSGAPDYPCTAHSPCGCRHVVRQTRCGFQAFCRCEGSPCSPWPVEPGDLRVFELDSLRLCAALAGALALVPAARPWAPAPPWILGSLPDCAIRLCSPLAPASLNTSPAFAPRSRAHS